MDESRLGKRVRELREGRGWTQSHLAEVTGLDERTIRRVERGSTPALDTLQALAQAFDVECAELKHLTEEEAGSELTVHLIPILNGREFFAVLAESCAYEIVATDADSTIERDLVKALLDQMEYREIWDVVTPGDRYDAEQNVSEILRQLDGLSWRVLVERRKGTLRTPLLTMPNWVTVKVIVIKVSRDEERSEQSQVPNVHYAGNC